MPTQKAGYYTKDGTRVPSVTTIIGRFKESGALIHWAAGAAADYIAANVHDQPTKSGVLQLCHAAKTAYRDVRDEAASAGTMAHGAVERWIKHEAVVFDGPLSIAAKAERSFEAFLEWASQTQLEVTHTELPLVSEHHKFGGTLDAMLIRGKRACGDWKTSNAIYSDYLIQIAAYGILWDENNPDMKIDGGYHLLRFDKTYGDFHAHFWAELETAKRSFLLMRELYANDSELKARAK